ncbi:cytosolic phospholipase A2 isoform X2 [Petromyzon marinus]|uniref:Phospholipase A2 n=1 Tax=Petromyzon marinus TaxID=7757 RepID=A0AAJ7WY38_PETMA|nr:cytosolic phospholipase A2 [Petromyzon marinus]
MPRLQGVGADSYQFSVVPHQVCHKLVVKVLRAENVTKGRLGDMMDTPDPYVVLDIRLAADSYKRTRHLDNDVNPTWNESFDFLIDLSMENILEVTLMDANYTVDEKLGSQNCNLRGLLHEGQSYPLTLTFNKVTKVYLELHLEVCTSSDLRFSIHLCQEESEFRARRKEKVFESIKKLLGPERAPRSHREVPTVAVLGSGGGFRAMTAMAGVFKALQESGVLDCTTYVAGLSGSSWYLSTLFSHPEWPRKPVWEVNQEVKVSASHSRFYLLRPQSLRRYVEALWKKKRLGQPVTFTDVFGLLIGETLIPNRMQAKLSDMKRAVQGADTPLPLITCLHVKPDVSEIIYADWVEFSPFEIGMAKYGTFMRPELFGSKFFKGIAVRKYEEYPLHFLMGVWGSAFSILFNRVFQLGDKGECKTTMEEEIASLTVETITSKQSASDSDDEDSTDGMSGGGSGANADGASEQATAKACGTAAAAAGGGGGGSWVERMLTTLVGDTTLFTTREGRAGKVFNFMRGLDLTNVPRAPFTPASAGGSQRDYTDHDVAVADPEEFGMIYEPLDVCSKKIHVVDSGLTFNLPFPLVLRPQRGIDLILSFDFSARPSDCSRPFKELLLAEKWARMHKLPFPRIDENVFDREGLKECYIFKPQDAREERRCPTIVHFVLANIDFRKFKAPGVPRTTKEEMDYGDFDIFDDPCSPYSTFNFHYAPEAFQRLHDLMEFNTLNNIQAIKDAIELSIDYRRRNPTRQSVTLAEPGGVLLRPMDGSRKRPAAEPLHNLT